MSTKVVLGFSGGVDSTAAALLLKDSGYEVAGLYFDVLGREADPRIFQIADSIGIKLFCADASDIFRSKVIEPFKSEYEAGRTPNPCIFCNPAVKFKLLCQKADELGFEYIATGHYAGVDYSDGIYRIRKAANLIKDQSYMLYRLPQSVLSRTVLPLEKSSDKEFIRQLVRDKGIENWDTSDSQDICFIPDGDYAGFLLSQGACNKPGVFKDKDGRLIAPHKGILHYTVGQRKGLGVALGAPAFVTSIDAGTGDIILGSNQELLHNNVIVNQLFFSGLSLADARIRYDGQAVNCKLRYSSKEAVCMIRFKENDTVDLEFEQPQRAPTPGQSAVFYNSDLVIGGGIIVK